MRYMVMYVANYQLVWLQIMMVVSDMSIAIIDDRLLISSCCKLQETQTSLDTTRCSIDGIDTSSFVF